MTLGLPNHLIAPTMSGVLARAAQWFGLVCLAGALTSIIAVSTTGRHGDLWPTILALAPMALLLVTLTRHRTVLAAAGYLVVGAGSTFVYSVTLLSAPDVFPSTDLFVLALPVMALVIVGGADTRPLIGLLWSTAGLVLGTIAVFAAAVATGVPFRPDGFATASYLLIATILVATARTRGRAAQPTLHQATRRDTTLAVRRTLDARATALMHDTALSHLSAIAAAAPGPLDPRMRALIARDLERLIGQDWLLSHEPHVTSEPEWERTPLAEAIASAREQGLTVDVTGDRTAAVRLDPERAEALGLATLQCLVNVLRHAGVTDADLTISADETSVAVTVTDAGSGFRTDGARENPRIGLRHSVRARIEGAGGTVQVWSTPGAGTSVLLSVPLTDAPQDPRRQPGGEQA